jgi:hypothetical protein
MQPPERLLAATTRGKLLGVHAYLTTPDTLASDIATDFRVAADIVPEIIQREMVPLDEEAEKRANATASQWLVQVLQPEKDQPVGVIIVWPEAERRLNSDNSKLQPIFVMLKGQLENGSYVIKQVSFGDPLESPR